MTETQPISVRDLRVKIFADGADRDGIMSLAQVQTIKGFTTNPTLMRQAGIGGYETFAREILTEVTDRPISFEVFSDEFDEMERQALKIAGWASNVYVKIPVTNTRKESSAKLIAHLANAGVKVNATALMTLAQVETVAAALAGGPPSCISVFAGRIADTGRDPIPLMSQAIAAISAWPTMELIWASPREVLNIIQADEIGCHIITVTHDLLKKLDILGRDLDEYSLDTVKMFHRDAQSAGYQL